MDSFAVNEAALLLSMVAANLMHAGRLLAQHPNAQLWSRETFRRLVLKAPGRVARSSPYVTLWIQERWAAHWSRIGVALRHLPSARGSPSLQALPRPASHPTGRGARSQGGPPTKGGGGILSPKHRSPYLSQTRTPPGQESSKPRARDELARVSAGHRASVCGLLASARGYLGTPEGGESAQVCGGRGEEMAIGHSALAGDNQLMESIGSVGRSTSLPEQSEALQHQPGGFGRCTEAHNIHAADWR